MCLSGSGPTFVSLSMITSSFSVTSTFGILVVRSAASVAMLEASIRLPSWSSTYMSIQAMRTFFPGIIASFSRSIALISLSDLSMTLASSMAFSSGGPGSKLGDAIGTNSAETTMTPSFGVSAYGVPSSSFTPTSTCVLPSLT